MDTYLVLSKKKATTNTENDSMENPKRKCTCDEDYNCYGAVNPSQSKKSESNKMEIPIDEFDAYKDDTSIEDDVFFDDSINPSHETIFDKNMWKPEIPFENVTQMT